MEILEASITYLYSSILVNLKESGNTRLGVAPARELVGYCIDRNHDEATQRSLTPKEFSILRVLIHASLLMSSALQLDQNINRYFSIYPVNNRVLQIQINENLPSYFADRMKHDLVYLGKLLGNNFETACEVVQTVLHIHEADLLTLPARLSQKNHQAEWERQFSSLLRPTVENALEKYARAVKEIEAKQKCDSKTMQEIRGTLEGDENRTLLIPLFKYSVESNYKLKFEQFLGGNNSENFLPIRQIHEEKNLIIAFR